MWAAESGHMERHAAYEGYYYVYWISYLVGAGIVFFAIQEIFRHLMEPLTGLGRFGLVAFRWVTLTAILVAVVFFVLPKGVNGNLLISTTSGVMRCMSILELSLLAFIVLSMQTLRISLRSRDFGVVLGLGLIAAANLFDSSLAFEQTTMASLANYLSQTFAILASCVWIGYFLRSSPEAKPAQSPANSTIARWNEVAIAYMQPPQQVVFSAPNDFFLQDVERTVDRILEKNSLNNAG